MTVIRFIRLHDPYLVNDFIVRWIGKQVHRRQQIGLKMVKQGDLYTPYAEKYIGKQEVLASESDMKPTAEGTGLWCVTHTTRKGVHNYHVDLKAKTCSCYKSVAALMPCPHEIVVLDHLKRRSTIGLMLEFRKEYVAPYFWSENYIAGYEGLRVQSPVLNKSRILTLNEGDKQILPPLFEPRVPYKRTNKNRADRSVNYKRTRAVWDKAGYVARQRKASGKNGPRNPFVIISKPNTFKKDPRGRKGSIQGKTPTMM